MSELDLVSFSLNHMDMIIKTEEGGRVWRATGIYGFPESTRKHLTCTLLHDLGEVGIVASWLAFGDFNLVASAEEKKGGASVNINHMELFRDTLHGCGLHDLGYEGSTFTWCNRQGETLSWHG